MSAYSWLVNLIIYTLEEWNSQVIWSQPLFFNIGTSQLGHFLVAFLINLWLFCSCFDAPSLCRASCCAQVRPVCHGILCMKQVLKSHDPQVMMGWASPSWWIWPAPQFGPKQFVKFGLLLMYDRREFLSYLSKSPSEAKVFTFSNDRSSGHSGQEIWSHCTVSIWAPIDCERHVRQHDESCAHPVVIRLGKLASASSSAQIEHSLSWGFGASISSPRTPLRALLIVLARLAGWGASGLEDPLFRGLWWSVMDPVAPFCNQASMLLSWLRETFPEFLSWFKWSIIWPLLSLDWTVCCKNANICFKPSFRYSDRPRPRNCPGKARSLLYLGIMIFDGW